ncbi:glycoside hydrolase [Kineosporia rhizophila]|uniref:sialidase family protein n=1 Tax=Kineosporia rhizophila TaxID=84633 RepID=UPI001E3D2F36|nr:sialidase family protein [Kineosporia rhizophila]MCE0533960.1 glycoside hydrolase [Kineosporia rhizophila]
MTRPSFRRFAGGLIACCTAVSGLALGTAVSASAGASSAHAPQVTGVQKATRCVSTPFRSQPAKTLWYRIPSVVRTNAGTLLAFAEARDNSDASDMGDYDIALARSTDGGCSWSEPRVIASDAANRVASPSAMVDRETGKILLFSNITERPNSGGRGKGLYLQTSTDDGKSFSPLLANQIRPNDDIRGGMPGPGHGIQLTRTNKGRLVVPVVYRTKEGVYGAYGIYSDDHGKSWQVGYHQLDHSRKQNWIEGTVAETDNGDVFISYRAGRHGTPAGQARVWGISKDGGRSLAGKGLTRSKLPVVSVQGSALVPTGRYDDVLLYSSPAERDRNLRRDMSIFVSDTGGRTWDSRYQMKLHSTPAAYSDLVQLGSNLGILYETGVVGWKEEIVFETVPISQVLNPTKVGSRMSFYRNPRPVPASQNAKAQVRIKVPGTARPQGRVTLTATADNGRKSSASVDLTYSNRGSRWVVLPKLDTGTYRLTLTYSGTVRIKGTTVSAGTLRVTR